MGFGFMACLWAVCGDVLAMSVPYPCHVWAMFVLCLWHIRGCVRLSIACLCYVYGLIYGMSVCHVRVDISMSCLCLVCVHLHGHVHGEVNGHGLAWTWCRHGNVMPPTRHGHVYALSRAWASLCALVWNVDGEV